MTKRLGTKALAACVAGAVLTVLGVAGVAWACSPGATTRATGQVVAAEARTAGQSAAEFAFYGGGGAVLLAEELGKGAERAVAGPIRPVIEASPVRPAPAHPVSDGLTVVTDVVDAGVNAMVDAVDAGAQAVEDGTQLAAAGLGDGDDE